MSVAVTYTSREEIDVHRFSWGISVGIPLLAIFLQIFLPVRLSFLTIFDLPLLVTIYFGVARRNQISGLLTGGVIGTQLGSRWLPVPVLRYLLAAVLVIAGVKLMFV